MAMSAGAGHDLGGIIKWWSAREDWRPRVDVVMAEHFEPAMKAFGLGFEEIGATLGGTWALTLWGGAFEDFLTRRFGPDNENPVEAYLRRRRWQEPVEARTYMAAVRTSAMSLYEASDIIPGQSFRARDLVRGGDPLLVSERTATRTLKTWDRIAGRVVEHNGKTILAGGLLSFTLEASEGLLSRLRDHVPDAGAKRHDGTSKAGALKGWRGSDEDLRRAAPLFTAAWLFDVLPRTLHTDSSKLFNSEGDEILFHRINFPLTEASSADAIVARLNQLTDLRQASATFWNWLGDRAASSAVGKGGKGITFNSTMEDGSPVLGTIEVNERFVLLEANSPARAQKGTAMLAAALDGLVASPLTEIQTVEQMQAAARRKPKDVAAAIPPDIKEKLVHDALDQHYRALLDKPTPMLDDVSPRAVSRTSRSREILAVWLKHLENRSRHTKDRNDPMATYDFTWMWRELNVEHLRD
jgi:hypothetical protein